MGDLTLDERARYAAQRAREQVAEKHFFDAAQPFFPLGFSVFQRNPGHWDVTATSCPGQASAWLAANPTGQTTAKDGQRERAFRIRGERGAVTVYDERWNPHQPHPREPMIFRSVTGAMLWIVEEMMQEPSDA
ncbi:hypothetical protein [Methylobacterium sp. SD21]|uniref:hypothetical protein n=1 Tax=Methylobacterium litchii TaxID=3138810 RepID=UPI00313D3E22